MIQNEREYMWRPSWARSCTQAIQSTFCCVPFHSIDSSKSIALRMNPTMLSCVYTALQWAPQWAINALQYYIFWSHISFPHAIYTFYSQSLNIFLSLLIEQLLMPLFYKSNLNCIEMCIHICVVVNATVLRLMIMYLK